MSVLLGFRGKLQNPTVRAAKSLLLHAGGRTGAILLISKIILWMMTPTQKKNCTMYARGFRASLMSSWRPHLKYGLRQPCLGTVWTKSHYQYSSSVRLKCCFCTPIWGSNFHRNGWAQVLIAFHICCSKLSDIFGVDCIFLPVSDLSCNSILTIHPSRTYVKQWITFGT